MPDNGKGGITTIEQDNCEHIFEPYTRNMNGRKNNGKVAWLENKNVAKVFCKKCLIIKKI